MWNDPLFLLVAFAMLVVVVILARGIGSIGKDGISGAKRSNKLMQYRIGAQALAVVLILILIYLRRGAN